MARQTLLHSPRSASPNQSAPKRSYRFAQVAIRTSSTRELTSRHLARPTTHPLPQFSQITSPVRTWPSATIPSLSPGDEWDSSSSISDSDSDSEDEDRAEEYTLPEEHEWQRLRSELLQLAQIQLKEFSSRVQYDASPLTRSRMVKRQLEPLCFEEYQDPSDTELVVLFRPPKMRRHFHHACPFYVSDPVKYKQCLLLYNQQSIEGLIDHLTRHHIKPFYCARCSETFDTPISRDNHILDDKCELLDPKPMDGIDQYQRSRLWKKDRWHLDERKRWRRIWTTVFPSQPPRSPYLDQGLGLEVSIARDYWSLYGWRCVSDFLSDRGLIGYRDDDEEKALDALCDLVQEDLLVDIIGGCSPVGAC